MVTVLTGQALESKTTGITFRPPLDVAEKIDEAADKLHLSRSDLLTRLCIWFTDQNRSTQLAVEGFAQEKPDAEKIVWKLVK